MRISIIIPCFQAEFTLARAVASIASQSIFDMGYSGAPEIEVVLSADDDGDYTAMASIYPQLKIIPPQSGRHGTGPGATRNRGIRTASGDYLAFLDADDEWASDYLAELIPLARAQGAAFAPTAIFNHHGRHVMTLGEGQSHLTPHDFGRWPGSFHPLVHRDLSSGFSDGAGQDVFHALDVIGRLGGVAPLARQTSYRLHLKDGSVTADPSFSRKIDRRYRQYIHMYRAYHTSLSGMARLRAMQALHRRMRWNAKWLAQERAQDGFYGFVAYSKGL